jgi:DNA-directed RNA polymerase specialized sigma24 family protein
MAPTLPHLAGERVWSLLADLTDGERSAIVLAYYGGHTYRQVAALLAQPEATIKSRLQSGLSRLRNQRATNAENLGPGRDGASIAGSAGGSGRGDVDR